MQREVGFVLLTQLPQLQFSALRKNYSQCCRDSLTALLCAREQFSFMARTHPQSLRQETSVRLRGVLIIMRQVYSTAL